MTAYDPIFFATEQTIEKYVVTLKSFFFDISEMGGFAFTSDWKQYFSKKKLDQNLIEKICNYHQPSRKT